MREEGLQPDLRWCWLRARGRILYVWVCGQSASCTASAPASRLGDPSRGVWNESGLVPGLRNVWPEDVGAYAQMCIAEGANQRREP